MRSCADSLRKILLPLLILALSGASFAQTYTTVTAANIADAGGDALANGTISFTQTNGYGVGIGFNPSGGGVGILRSYVCNVVNGAITTAVTTNSDGSTVCHVANTALTTPANICYNVTIFDADQGVNVQGPGLSCVQPTGATWSLDAFKPNLAAVLPVQQGPVGPQGLGSRSSSTPFSIGAAGTKVFNHGLNSTSPQVQGLYISGNPNYTATVVDANNISITTAGPLSMTLVVTAPGVTSSGVLLDPLLTGAVAHYPLTETSAPPFIDTVAANNITVASGFTPSSTGAQFANGAAAIMLTASEKTLLNGQQPYWISFGVNLTTATTTSQITLFGTFNPSGDSSGTELVIDNNNRLAFVLASSLPSSQLIYAQSPVGALAAGSRVSVIVAYDGSGHAAGVSMLLNGSPVAITVALDTLSGTIAYPTTNAVLVLMATPTQSTPINFANGIMDSFRINLGTPSAQQIAALQNGAS